MRTRIIVGVTLMIALLGAGTYVSRAGEVGGRRQWTVINFVDPVQVKDQIMMGPVLIVHDDEKMGRGKACTTLSLRCRERTAGGVALLPLPSGSTNPGRSYDVQPR